MINRILPFLSNLIPGALAVKGLSKVDPRLSKFFSNAATAGFGTDAALNFLRNKLTSPASQSEQQRLQAGMQRGNLRPDEQASFQNIKHSQAPANAIQKSISAATGLGAGIIGGVDGDQSKDQGQQQQQQPAQQEGDRKFDSLAGLQEFPELVKFIQEEQARGGNAQSIGSKARKSARLSTFVNAIEQNIDEPFESLLDRLLGQNQQSQPKFQSQQSSLGKTDFMKGLSDLGQMLQGLKR